MPAWDVHFNCRVRTDHQKVIDLVAKSHALASVIRGIPIPPGAQRRIDALNIMRAVRGTTGIEGAELSEEEVQQIMEAPPDKAVLPRGRRREEREARNAAQAMYFVVEQLTREPATPLTEELVCRIHEIITRDIKYPNNIPGRYRSHPTRAGTYLPPSSGEDVRRLMKEFIEWFNAGPPTNWDPIVRAIIAHFYIISIHPFGDGNGRTARGAESLLLYKAGVNARGFYSLSNYYYRNRSEYEWHLDHVRFETRGDVTPFVLFALQGLVDELEIVHGQIMEEVRFIAFRDFGREVLSMSGKFGTKSGERMFHFLLGLDRTPISLKALRGGNHLLSRLYRNVTSRTLARDVDFLKQQKLVVVNGDELRPNLEIMTLFTPPTELWLRRGALESGHRTPKPRKVQRRRPML